MAPKRVTAATLTHYRADARLYLIPALGRLKLAEVTPARVQAMLNGLAARGLGPNTERHCRAVLRVALGQAQREGRIGQNAAKLVTTTRMVRKHVAALTPEDARALLTAFAGHEFEALVTLALATGLRQGELLGLGWADVDLDTGTLSVRRQLQRQDGEYRLTAPKTEQSRLTLALPRVAVDALRSHRARQAAARLLAGPAWQDMGLVFTTAAGGYLNGSTVTHRFQDRLRDVGLPAMAFHDLRHGAASLLLAQGASMRVVMEQLGHSQSALTMNTYAHIGQALMRDAADRLDRALGGQS